MADRRGIAVRQHEALLQVRAAEAHVGTDVLHGEAEPKSAPAGVVLHAEVDREPAVALTSATFSLMYDPVNPQVHPVGHPPGVRQAEDAEVRVEHLAGPSGASSVVTMMSPMFRIFIENPICPWLPRWVETAP